MLLPRKTGEAIHSDEDWFFRRDGSMFPVSYWSAPIESPAGRGAVVAFTDIEEQRAIDQVLRDRDTILETVAQPVFVTDSEGRIRYANPAAVETLGFDDLSELAGQSGHWLVHYKRPDGSPFPIEECQFRRPRQLDEPAQVGEDWFVRKDGSMIPLAYTASPIAAPAGIGTVIAFTDVRERRAAERAARERDAGRGPGGRGPRRTTADHRRRAPPGHAQPARRRPAAVRQRRHQPPAGPAEMGVRAGPRQGAARRCGRPGEGRHRRPARAGRGHPPIAPDHTRTARRCRGAGRPAADSRRAARHSHRPLLASDRSQRLLSGLRGAHERRQARPGLACRSAHSGGVRAADSGGQRRRGRWRGRGLTRTRLGRPGGPGGRARRSVQRPQRAVRGDDCPCGDPAAGVRRQPLR
jgi:PAS domain S-box-containing protein